MKIKRIITAILLCIMLASTLCACSEQTDAPDGFQLVVCEGDKFRLYVPTQGWAPNTDSGTATAILSVDPYIAISAFVADDAGDMDVDAYWSYSETLLMSEFGEENYTFVSGGDAIILDGQPAKKYVYTVKTDALGTEATEYKVLCVLCRYKEEMYVITYTAPADEQYDLYRESVEDEGGVLEYFRFDVPYSGKGKEYPDGVAVPEGMKLISTDEHPYRFFVPAAWKTNEKTGFSAAYVSASDTSNVSLQFMMVSEQEIGKKVEEYFAECEEGYKKTFSLYERLSEEDVTMGGKTGKKYTYRIVSGGVEYKQMQAIVVKNGVFYVLTYTATPDRFDTHLPDVQRMIDTFEIRK